MRNEIGYEQVSEKDDVVCNSVESFNHIRKFFADVTVAERESEVKNRHDSIPFFLPNGLKVLNETRSLL